MEDSRMRRNALPSVWPYPRSNGSIVTVAAFGPIDSTSIARGFNIAVDDMDDPCSIPSARYADKADGWSGQIAQTQQHFWSCPCENQGNGPTAISNTVRRPATH